MKRFLIISICLCLNTDLLIAQSDFHFKNNRKKELVPFVKARGLMIVSTFINNKGPFNFVMDTGVGLMVITDPALKDSLNIQFLRKIKLAGLGDGKDIDAYLIPSMKVSIGNINADNISAAIFDKDIFSLSAYAGMQIHGLIGYDFFKNFIVRIYYDAGYLLAYDKDHYRLFKKGSRIPISIEGNKPYCETILTLDNGEKITTKMIIDTGAGHPISLESLKGGVFPLPDKFMIANLGVGLNGKINGFIGRIKSIELGKYAVKQVLASFPNYADVAAKITSVPRNGSIGNQILNRFDVIFDYNRGFIYLKPNILFKTSYEHDMSGIELVSGGDNFDRVFIAKIEPQSPADEIDLMENDELLSINLKKISDFKMEDIIEIFKSKDGRNLFIELSRNNEVLSKIITLRRRM